MKSFLSAAPALPPPPYTSLTTTSPGDTTVGATIEKLHASSTVIVSGGSFASWSETCDAVTVTVHVSPVAKFVAGSSVNVVGPPLTVAACEPLVAQAIVNQAPVTFTG